jgi:hypothetical protein
MGDADRHGGSVDLQTRSVYRGKTVIVSWHVASGAAVGALAGSRGRAIAYGALLHVLSDAVPHWDIASRRFEFRSGVLMLGTLMVLRGPLDLSVIGAVASSAPDVEHVVRLPRPGGRKLFPSHRWRGWHRAGGVPASAQLLVAGVLFGVVARRSAVR